MAATEAVSLDLEIKDKSQFPGTQNRMEKETLPVTCGDKSYAQLTSDRKSYLAVKMIGVWRVTLSQQYLLQGSARGSSSFDHNYPNPKSRPQQQCNMKYSKKPCVEIQLSLKSRGTLKSITAFHPKNELQLLFDHLEIMYEITQAKI